MGWTGDLQCAPPLVFSARNKIPRRAFLARSMGGHMTTSEAEAAAEGIRAPKQDAVRQPLSTSRMDALAIASEEYHQAKRDLLARRTENRSDPESAVTLQPAIDRFERARQAVKQAIRI